MAQPQQQLQPRQSSLQLFEHRLPAWPYCSNSVSIEGLERLPLEQALQKRLIQPNTAKRHVCLCFDVDRTTASDDWAFRNLPPPNLTVGNPANGHAHLIYLLDVPVPVSEISRIKPIRLMAAVQEGLRRALQADKGYAGLVVKNPKHKHWRTIDWHSEPYGLAELAEYLEAFLPSRAEMNRRAKCQDYAGLGRNCTTFEAVRLQAYSLVRGYWEPGGEKAFESAVLDAVLAFNYSDIGNPMDHKECRTIARSIARWTWRRFTPGQFRQIQATRGKAKGSAKRMELLPRAKAMAAEGVSLRLIAQELGVSHQTISDWLKRDLG